MTQFFKEVIQASQGLNWPGSLVVVAVVAAIAYVVGVVIRGYFSFLSEGPSK